MNIFNSSRLVVRQVVRKRPQVCFPCQHQQSLLSRRTIQTSKPNATNAAAPTAFPGVGSKTPFKTAFLAGVVVFSFAVGISLSPRTTFDAPVTIGQFDTSSAFENREDVVHDVTDSQTLKSAHFRLSEIRKHDGNSENPWVIRGDKVYDITDWVAAHPGGKIILKAAGGSIDRYWDIFAIHKTQYVYDILEQYFIGHVHPDDLQNGRPPQEQIEDPFADDPERHPSLITRTAHPRNAETPGDAISAAFLTPNELFYVRNHMWVPRIAEAESDKFVLTIEMLDGATKEYTLADLKTKFPKRQITAALQCSGNRRQHMSDDSGRKANGLPWTAGAISNASWEGVLLADVLADAGFENNKAMVGSSDVKHVHFTAMEAYAASIPVKKAVDPQGDVLLAYGMNGKTLPRDHGYPLRAIVPGNVAARSVKWLNQITLSDEESTSQWQRKDYKCFGPNETKVDWDAAPSIQELPIQSAITTVKLGGWALKSAVSNEKTPPPQQQQQSTEPAQDLAMAGYAFSGGGRSVIRVDVSLDNGKTWSQAKLLPDGTTEDGSAPPNAGSASWAWKRWRFESSVPLKTFTESDNQESSTINNSQSSENNNNNRRCTTIAVKATDENYNTQPETHAAIWNVRGNLANAWHRVQVCTDCSTVAAASSASTTTSKEKGVN